MKHDLIIRYLRDGEEFEAFNLLRATIRSVNCKDYDENQIDAWAPKEVSKSELHSNLGKIRRNKPFVATVNNKILGFADLQADGYIDQFFCCSEHQGQGIGRALMAALLEKAKAEDIKSIYSNVSVTAKPFFSRFGFKVVKRQKVSLRSQVLVNYRMVMRIGN